MSPLLTPRQPRRQPAYRFSDLSGSTAPATFDQLSPVTFDDLDRGIEDISLGHGSRKGKAEPPDYYAVTDQLVTAPGEHSILVEGPPGSGKTRRVAIRHILESRTPLIITSTKADLLEPILGWRQQLGPVVAYDPAGALPAEFSFLARTFTPLLGCDTMKNAGRTVNAMIDSIYGPKAAEEPFWKPQNRQFAAALLRHTFINRGCILDTWDLLTTARAVGPEGFMEVLADFEALAADGPASLTRDCYTAWHLFSDFVHMVPETLTGVVAGVRNLLEVYLYAPENDDAFWSGETTIVDPNLITLDTLLCPGTDQVGTILLFSPAEEQQLFGPVLATFGDYLKGGLFRTAFAMPGGQLDKAKRIRWILDEVANIFRINDLPGLIAQGRGPGMSVEMFIQDLSQFDAIYGEDLRRTIVNSCYTHMILPTNKDVPTLEAASAISGDKRIEVASKSRGEDRGKSQGQGASSKSRSESESESINTETRVNATVGQLSALPLDEAVIKSGPHWAQIKLIDYEDDPVLSKRANLSWKVTPPSPFEPPVPRIPIRETPPTTKPEPSADDEPIAQKARVSGPRVGEPGVNARVA